MLKIIFLGDIVGKIGREVVKKYASLLKEKYNADLIIANAENATHGKGLSKSHYDELIGCGIDVLTLGNHYNSKKEIYDYIDEADYLVRPLNLIDDIGGNKFVIKEVNGIKVRVFNIIGSAFMNVDISNPYLSLKNVLDEDDDNYLNIIDYHAEATSEKICFGYVYDGKVGAVLGTHTHVQTNDERILDNGTAFMCDIGMNGEFNSVLGFNRESVINKTIYGNNSPFTLNKNGVGLLSGVYLEFDETTLKCVKIEKISKVDYER